MKFKKLLLVSSLFTSFTSLGVAAACTSEQNQTPSADESKKTETTPVVETPTNTQTAGETTTNQGDSNNNSTNENGSSTQGGDNSNGTSSTNEETSSNGENQGSTEGSETQAGENSSESSDKIVVTADLVSTLKEQISLSKLYKPSYTEDDYARYGQLLIQSNNDNGTFLSDKMAPSVLQTSAETMSTKLAYLAELAQKVNAYFEAQEDQRSDKLAELESYVNDLKDDVNALLTADNQDLTKYLSDEKAFLRSLVDAASDKVAMYERVRTYVNKVVNPVVLFNRRNYPDNLRSQAEQFARDNRSNLVFAAGLTEVRKLATSRGLFLVNKRTVQAYLESPISEGGGKEAVEYVLNTLYPTLEEGSEDQALVRYLKYAVETVNLSNIDIILINKLYGKHKLEVLWENRNTEPTFGGGSTTPRRSAEV
ncbi:hypothetical protein [Mycoplasmopsis columboralis]|uniref:Lipoprotein n=1 Tax=Mycoplasmopsis columboralis TaxID=171282 RepID=A0A449B6F6_9BACT|nr:hypothetical protein [Mycoplasmopsis columboralis]VEU76186.1 Uncharacterised protein [Mycoplasmopsis columboralis]